MFDKNACTNALSAEKFSSIDTLRLENKKNLIRAAYRTLLFREVDEPSLNHLTKILHKKNQLLFSY